MNRILTSLVCFLALSSTSLDAQKVDLNEEHLQPVGVTMSVQRFQSKKVVRVLKNAEIKEFDEPTFVRIKGVDFTDGIIEVKVLSRLLPDAPEFARGFIGLAFRINDSNTRYESIYIRPTNGRSDDQVRRNHSVQYYSYPDFKFDRLRKESPERYESYADMALNQLISMRLEVKGSEAKLFLNGNKQPSLVVNDLKHGSKGTGAIGLWVDVGTEGFFTDLKIK